MAASFLDYPEVVPDRGLQVPFDGIEAEQEGPERLAEKASVYEKKARLSYESVQINPARWLARYRWIIAIGMVATIIIAVVVPVEIRTHHSPRFALCTPGVGIFILLIRYDQFSKSIYRLLEFDP